MLTLSVNPLSAVSARALPACANRAPAVEVAGDVWPLSLVDSVLTAASARYEDLVLPTALRSRHLFESTPDAPCSTRSIDVISAEVFVGGERFDRAALLELRRLAIDAIVMSEEAAHRFEPRGKRDRARLDIGKSEEKYELEPVLWSKLISTLTSLRATSQEAAREELTLVDACLALRIPILRRFSPSDPPPGDIFQQLRDIVVCYPTFVNFDGTWAAAVLPASEQGNRISHPDQIRTLALIDRARLRFDDAME